MHCAKKIVSFLLKFSSFSCLGIVKIATTKNCKYSDTCNFALQFCITGVCSKMDILIHPMKNRHIRLLSCTMQTLTWLFRCWGSPVQTYRFITVIHSWGSWQSGVLSDLLYNSFTHCHRIYQFSFPLMFPYLITRGKKDEGLQHEQTQSIKTLHHICKQP